MNVGLIGVGKRGSARASALAAMADVQIAGIHDADVQQAETVAAELGVPAVPGALDLMRRVDALFVAAPTMDHFVLAREAIRQGVHVFLEWPPATSVTESEKLARVAEEAGVEIGVSRTLRFHPALGDLPPVRAGILMLHREAGSLRWPVAFADAIDLCAALAQTPGVQRLDAEAVRRSAALLDTVAFNLRFQNGTYAQALLRQHAPASVHTLRFTAPGHSTDCVLADTSQARRAALEAETRAFCTALARRDPAPVPLYDALHTLRLVEKLLARLR